MGEILPKEMFGFLFHKNFESLKDFFSHLQTKAKKDIFKDYYYYNYHFNYIYIKIIIITNLFNCICLFTLIGIGSSRLSDDMSV